MSRFFQALAYLWASPATLIGLALGGIGLASGGKSHRMGRILEFHGGGVAWLLAKAPIGPGGAAAMTLGHVVLGRSLFDLDRTRAHEEVHVAQYERWGPLFLPAYLSCSAWLWLRGRDPYYDNPFEREAYDSAD